MIVSGLVTQIIPPEDHDNYFYAIGGIGGVRRARGMYVVNLMNPNIPKGFVGQLRFWWEHRKERNPWGYHTLVMNDCPYREGELISVDVEPFLPAVELWTPLSEKEK